MNDVAATIPKVTHTPPMSPSFLRVSYSSTTSNNSSSNNTNNGTDYFRQSNDEYVFTTRSSSLNRATSSSSGRSIVHLNNNRMVPPSPNKTFFSNPTSPLAFEINTVEESVTEIPNHALLTYIANHFINAVALLNERRRIYCSAEYPLSFTGEEAIVRAELCVCGAVETCKD